MKFKALVFDLDGTAIPKKRDGMPSQVVIDAVLEARKFCHVAVATGRPLELCKEIIDAFGIEDLAIVNGGTHLYSIKERDFIWKQEIDSKTLTEVYASLKDFSHYRIADEANIDLVPMNLYPTDRPVCLSCIFATKREDADKILSILESFENISANATGSWSDGMFDVHITHKLATKKHALQKLLSHLNVDSSETIVVGDGGNDLPLFEAAGFKVAVGNAEEALKSKADWIAPPVDEDGLAVTIKKFIVDSHS